VPLQGYCRIVSNHLLYLVYGQNPTYHREARLSVLSALAWRNADDDFSIHVMTDQPDVFAGWPVHVIALASDTLAQWRGTHGYTHRIKACAIAAGARLGERTLFIDTDTLFKTSPSALFEAIAPGAFVVDEFEFDWQEARQREEFSALARHAEEHGQTSATSSLRLYNSGLCGLHRDDAGLMDEVIARIDHWSAQVKGLHTLEQVALSFSLDGLQVTEGRPHIVHYYAEKEFFHAMAASFFAHHGSTFSQALVAASREFPRERPRLSPLRRGLVKLRTATLPEALQRPARHLLYGYQMGGDRYQQSCAPVFWSKGIKALDKAELAITPQWPKGLPRPGRRHRASFEAFLQTLGGR